MSVVNLMFSTYNIFVIFIQFESGEEVKNE